MPTVQQINDYVERYAAEKGIPIQQAFQELGMKVQKGLQPAQDALQQMSNNISNVMNGSQQQMTPPPVPGPAPDPNRNAPTLLNQDAYQQNLHDKLKAIGDAETLKQQNIDSFNPDEYTKYSMGGEVEEQKPRFSHLQDMVSKHKKANAELEASANPEKFLKKMKNPSIKGKKGIAF